MYALLFLHSLGRFRPYTAAFASARELSVSMSLYCYRFLKRWTRGLNPARPSWAVTIGELFAVPITHNRYVMHEYGQR